MLQYWKKNLKKTKIINLFIFIFSIGVFLTSTAFIQDNLKDYANLTDQKTRQLIAEKNNRYLQTKEEPRIVVITLNRLDNLTPSRLNKTKRTAYIVVGQKDKRRELQIYSSKDLHSAFTAESRMNIIRLAGKDLRSHNKKQFNKGLRLVFRACATKIDQQYQYTLDKYDLTNAEQNKIDHPNRVALPIAFGIVILVGALIYFLKTIQNRNSKNKK